MGPDRLAVRPHPPDQRFNRHHPSAAGIDQRLIVDLEFAVLQRVAQFLIKIARGLQVLVELRLVPAAPHLAAALGNIHRNVGAAQQLGRRQALNCAGLRQADTGTECDPALLDRERPRQPVKERAAYPFQNCSGSGATDGDRKLVATKAIGARMGTAHGLQFGRDQFDQTVADIVAIEIVDGLEPVQIDQSHRHAV